MSTESEWIEWSGGECPVAEGTLVDVRHRDGDEYRGESAMAIAGVAEDWSHDEDHDHPGDIVAYRLSDK